MPLIQTYDSPGDDPQYANFFGFGDESYASGQFLVIHCPTGRKFFGQIAAAQLNLNRDSLGQFHNTTLNQLEGVVNNKLNRSTVVLEAKLYRVQLLQDVTDAQPGSMRHRPTMTSLAFMATEDEVTRYINLPPINESMILGHIIDTEIRVCLSIRIIMHHLLIAGATGSGKSNTISNAILGAQYAEASRESSRNAETARSRSRMMAETLSIAQESGCCCIVLDHKPDFQDVHKPNDDGDQPYYQGLINVSYWSLGDSQRRDEIPIHIPASGLDETVLANAIFPNNGERLQAELLETLLIKFTTDRNGNPWTWAEFIDSVSYSAEDAQEKYGDMIHPKTWSAMKRKMAVKSRVPEWMNPSKNKPSYRELHRDKQAYNAFDLEKILKPGHVIVIRISANAGGGRGYGLFLSFLLRRIYELKSEKRVTCRVATFIDEAQDIFNAGPAFKEAVSDMLSTNIRKGRSMGIGYIVGVQSADAIPTEIRNNLNSQLIHRHNSVLQASEAMERATKEQLALSRGFGPGECLAYLFGATAVVHCQMRQSPFLLTKSDYD